MTCREISPTLFSDSRTLEDGFRALGVLRAGADGRGEAPPRLVFPEGYTAEEMPYLSGSDHLTFNVNPLFANGGEQLNCSLRALGYNADRARQIDTESNALTDDASYERYMANLSPQDALTYNIYRTLEVVNFFRTNAVRGNAAVGGNTDGNPDLITTAEIDAWAWEVSRHDNDVFFQQGGDVVARMHALVGLVTLLNSAPPITGSTPLTVTRGAFADVTAPAGGWRVGDRVFVDGALIQGNPTTGSDAFRIQASALPVGAHNVEIRRANGAIVRTPVTVTNPPEDPSIWNRIGSWASNHWQLLTGASVLLGFGALAYYFGSRNRGASNNPPPDQTKVRTEIIERRGSNPLPNQGGTAPINVEVKIDNSSDRTESRSEGRGSNPPPPPAGAAAGYDDVLRNLGEGAPGDGVLAALGEGENAPAPSANPFAEIMTYTVNDTSIESSLRAIDPALADFYRTNISNAANPVTNMSDLITRIAIANPEALTQAQAALAAEGRPATEMSERVMFELVSRAANWSPADAAARPALVTRFETAVRGARGVDRAETTDARAERERREREAREGREGERRSPVR